MTNYYCMKNGVLTKLLAENDISYADFAELADIPLSTLYMYGEGKRNVSESRVKKMAEEFGLRIEDIADAVGRKRAITPDSRSEVPLPGLRRCRLDAGLSQRALASKAGVSAASVVAWEIHGRRAEIVKARLLCKALGVQLADLVESTHTDTEAANMSLSELASALVAAVTEVRGENERLKATQRKWEEAFKVLGLAPIK